MPLKFCRHGSRAFPGTNHCPRQCVTEELWTQRCVLSWTQTQTDTQIRNRHTDVKLKLCTTGGSLLPLCDNPPPMNPSTAFIDKKNDVASPFPLVFKYVWRIFCGIFVSHQVLLLFFCFYVVYWNNTALCQKKKKSCRNYMVIVLFINISGLLCFRHVTEQFVLLWSETETWGHLCSNYDS